QAHRHAPNGRSGIDQTELRCCAGPRRGGRGCVRRHRVRRLYPPQDVPHDQGRNRGGPRGARLLDRHQAGNAARRVARTLPAAARRGERAVFPQGSEPVGHDDRRREGADQHGAGRRRKARPQFGGAGAGAGAHRPGGRGVPGIPKHIEWIRPTSGARGRATLERQAGTMEQRVREAITMANNEILRTARANPEFEGMACVLTLVLVENGAAVVGQVGDSRLYQVRRGEIRKITHDHSPVGEREDNGELSEADAMRHPRRNEVFRDVGSEEHTPGDADFIEVQSFPFESASALLLCSDGLSDQVSSAEIRASVERNAGNPEGAVRELIAAANRAGGKDNVTVLVVEGEQFRTPVVAATETAGNPWAARALLFAAGFVAAAALCWLTRSMWQP